MMKMLRSGYMASADMIIGKKAVAVFVSANPQFKGLDVYDKNMAIIRQDEIFSIKEEKIEKSSSTTKNISGESKIAATADEERFPWESQHDNDASKGENIGR